MDRPIAVGDLVVVVKATHCCGSLKNVGRVFRVLEFRSYDGKCAACGIAGDRSMLAFARPKPSNGYSLFRLKRIPPLGELEGERTEENLREPA